MNGNFTLKASAISAAFWFGDAIIHRFIYGEPEFEILPSEVNELWMRSVIVFLLIAFGVYADLHSKAMIRKEEEKRRIYNATVSSAQHILNNLLNQMQLLKMLGEDSGLFDEKTNAQCDQSIKEGKELVEKLSSLEELTEEKIRAAVYPKSPT